MMGERTVAQKALFYSFSLERHVPAGHMLRSIDRFVDLSGIREHLKPFYSETGRPSIDPELMIGMLIVGYCMGIRSERRLCDEVHLNLAYRWFCRLGLEGDVPDHSTFSKNRHGRFRDSDLLRRLFETTVERCMTEGLVGGEGFAVDVSLIRADANRQTGGPGSDGLPPEADNRAVREYLAVLDDAAFGAATPVVPKFLAPADPASRWTCAHGGQAYYAYSTNYLIDLDNAVIMDVEASTAIRQADVTACKRMIARVQDRFGIWPERLAADTGYGSAEMLAWLVHERDIQPHIPVFDKSGRRDGNFGRADFSYDHDDDSYVCPAGNGLRPRNRNFAQPRSNVGQDDTIRYRARLQDCRDCLLRQRCTPNMPARKVTRSIHEGARDLARQIATTDAYVTSRRERKKVEMLFAHLKRILKIDRLHLRGPNGAKDEFLLAATAQNLRKMAKLIPTQCKWHLPEPVGLAHPILAAAFTCAQVRVLQHNRPITAIGFTRLVLSPPECSDIAGEPLQFIAYGEVADATEDLPIAALTPTLVPVGPNRGSRASAIRGSDAASYGFTPHALLTSIDQNGS